MYLVCYERSRNQAVPYCRLLHMLKVQSSYFCLHLVRHTDTAGKKMCIVQTHCEMFTNYESQCWQPCLQKKSHLSVEGLWQIKQRHADLWLVALTLRHNPKTQLSSLGQSPPVHDTQTPRQRWTVMPYYPARACAKRLSNRFYPSVSLSVCPVA